MTRKLIRDTSEVARRIVDGELDTELDYILQAVQARRRNLYAPGRKVRVTRNTTWEWAGALATIIKVNPRRVVIGLGELGEYGTYEREFSVAPSMLEGVDIKE